MEPWPLPPANFFPYPLIMQPGVGDNLPAMPRITDEDLAASAPAVRALTVARLESIWRPVQEAIELGQDPAMPPPDPRLLEIGIRVIDRLSQLYGIAKPRPMVQEEEPDLGLDPAVDRRALVLGRLEEIEARIMKTANSD